jgi:hypothetical protein
MGSSKTGSLDKFVPFSPAAAFGSGKVKLPETGLIGMMQQGQEDKMAMNAANIAAQQKIDNQKAQQAALMETMRSRMQGGQGTPLTNLFMKEGGHVALRRKMFKLGGSANAHGVGLTSGLSFNQGGRVGLVKGGTPLSEIFKRMGKGAEVLKKVPARSPAGAALKGLGFLTDFLIPGSVSFARRVRRPSLIGRNLGTAAATIPILGGAAVGIGASRPGGLESLINPEADTTLERLANLPTRAGQLVGETATEIPARLLDALASVNIPDDPDGTTALSKAISGQGEFAKSIEKALYGREKTPEEEIMDDKKIDLGMTPDELGELATQRQREELEAAMAMYQDLIRGEDNTNKLATLGDAAIAAGSALMEGEGYGGAATAFNQPLAQARAAQRELDQTARGAAAQLAISQDIASRQQDEALFAELAATGQFDTAEQISQVVLARKFGITRVLPEDEKGEVDNDALITAGPGVYVDPKTREGGVFVAVDGSNPPKVKITNDPEAAKQHAKS